MPRKLDAGLDGRYGMSSVLMTSTMKSDPAGPLVCGTGGGVPVSAATMRADGGSADGSRGGASTGVAVVAAVGAAGATVVAAPATATPAKNLRRLNFASLSLRIVAPFRLFRAAFEAPLRSRGRDNSMGLWRHATRECRMGEQHRVNGKNESGAARAPLRLSSVRDQQALSLPGLWSQARPPTWR